MGWPWNRGSDDPLARMLFQTYQMHLLRRPRMDVAVHDVYALKDGQILPGKLSTLMQPPPPLAEVRQGEPVADLSLVVSRDLDTTIGVDFLETFLAGLGADALPLKLKGTLKAKKAAGVRFRFSGATRDYADPFKAEFNLRKHQVSPEGSLMKPGWQYFLVLGVLRTDSISLTAVNESGADIDIAAEAAKLAGSDGKLVVKKSQGEEITLSAGQPLAFGVELSEITFNEQAQRFELNVVRNAVKVRAGRARGGRSWVNYDLIGPPDGEAVLPDW